MSSANSSQHLPCFSQGPHPQRCLLVIFRPLTHLLLQGQGSRPADPSTRRAPTLFTSGLASVRPSSLPLPPHHCSGSKPPAAASVPHVCA